MNKVILITGASSGIGLASLKQLVGDGHTVYGSARKKEDLDEIKKAGGKPLAIEMTDSKTMEAAVKKIMKEQKRIDVVFNNAGYGLYGSVEDVPRDRYMHQFEVNLFGHAEMAKIVVPIMRRQKSGRLIYTSSMGGRIYMPFGAWYHATKHALEGWADCLRLELERFGIDVVIIEPGMINTNFGAVVGGPLVEFSKGGVYEKQVNKLIAGMSDPRMAAKNSDPSLIAGLVSRIVRSDNPKIRYLKGYMAKRLWLVRKWFGEKAYHRSMSKLIK